ncbi:MAG TPA: tRNA uridine-5-carboxymethylaminomethyl(34) synthesis enzyme MnmG [Bacteroidales bacterium]|nr:MAG: tRNA uridine 5-carboxymethylaminomethyl modification enzyme MnmG [Bacteroidetes bacterium ADurb.Bin037]HPV87878.1 tRNA uridine-5-carboxymethylaminomethyl(34) synthesis enzyme MnmG [Bacteroidales bacterium]HPW78021.1 tRNA uridine-5-carboxymethylaminomethyl(34) synthesis enzyme MnmG [Bacteroidales bacterium]HQB55287.1 tRNA uridine-5-carboxymethylaminomethyl(34) synthesis enzyme MnmG [Bacteroidales bacterium]
MIKQYDIIVVGAGHAGCEAAYATSKLGSKTLLITMDMTKMAHMSCNPAIGGIAKGQIVREIDALGGAMGIVTDKCTIQFRMLNRSKGPAMWSPRAQCDNTLYSAVWRNLLENTPNLHMWQDQVVSLLFNGDGVSGVRTEFGQEFHAKAIILTNGTFLNGKIFIGWNSTPAGRIGESPAIGLSKQLQERGIQVDRMKTGTPPRIDGRSVDFSKFEIQQGDKDPNKFSFLDNPSAIQEKQKQMNCYMVYTNSAVHDKLREGFDDSPLFSGRISGKGPRYCPSIEDKLKTFADKEQHPLFLEPEGWDTNEYYLQGFSSSLPIDIQLQAVRKVKGMENALFYRPGYAIEYDYFLPTQLLHTLEVKNIPNLFFAGQINGTTGYEEAAAQGIMAGINAHRKINRQESVILKRNQAYIGVLIDDLITKGVDEPYRMFTSRAEYRILLRQDNADERLTPLAFSIGMADEDRYKLFIDKIQKRDVLLHWLEDNSLEPDQINQMLERVRSTPISTKKRFADIIVRPQVSWEDIEPFVPRGTLYGKHPLSREIYESVVIAIKYRGYIEREKAFARKILRLDSVPIPGSFDYSKVASLSIESRQKLQKVKPGTIGQASRIPGVSPADISILLLYLGR